MLRLTAFLRTRLAGAVLMPALLGTAWAASRGVFELFPFFVMIVGLLAAEFADLILADLVAAGVFPGIRPLDSIALPGSPVSRRLLEKPVRSFIVLGLLAIPGALAFLFFLTRCGPGIFLPMAAALLCASLYAFQPFPGSFLATAFVPALITGAAWFAFSGQWRVEAFLAGLPITLLSTGVILTYRTAYRDGKVMVAGKHFVFVMYAAAFASIIALMVCGIYRWWALAALIPGIILVASTMRAFARETVDPVPATAFGVILHTAISLMLAFSILLGF